MDGIALPTYRDLLYPALVAVQQLGGSAAVAELDETALNVANVSEEQLAVEYPPESSASGPKVVHRLRWAITNLKAMGALDNSERGIWSLTPRGLAYLKMSPAVAEAALWADDKSIRAEWRKARQTKPKNGTRQPGKADQEEEDETEENEAPEDEQPWKDQLLDILKIMHPDAFERLAMRLLREAGFVNLEVTRSSGDEGIDGVGVYKPSLVSFPIYFQCKRYKGTVGPSVVRDFRGAMTGRGEKGLVITTGIFSPAAKKEATRDGAPPVDLIDGDELCHLLKAHGLGLRVEKRIVEDVTVLPAFFDSV